MAVVTINESTEIKALTTPLALAPTANSLDVVWVAPTTAADGVKFQQNGREVVLVMNTHGATAFAFTLKAVASVALLNRTGDVTYTLQAGEVCAIIIHPTGFKDSNGDVTITMADVAVKVGVLRIPNQVV